MKLTVRKLNKVLKSIKPIRIEFDEYDYDFKGQEVGRYYNEYQTIFNNDVYISFEIDISTSYSSLASDLITPLELKKERTAVYISINLVAIGDDEYKPNAKQLRAIEKEIKYNLMY